MVVQVSVILLLLIAGESETKTCDENYFRNSLPVTGTKDHLEHYPWHSYKPSYGEVTFLKITGDFVKEVCKDYLPRAVKEVIFLNLHLQYIEPGYFNNSEVVQVVIQNNNMTTVHSGVFSGTKIKSLVLTDNGIERIESYSFENMLALEAIALDNNKLKEFDPNWFENAQVLYEMTFRNNLLTEIPEDATKNMVSNHEEYATYLLYGSILFDNNRIKYIHPNAFRNLKQLSMISLSSNELLELPEQVFSGFQFLFSLHMNSNNFICFSNNTINSLHGVKILFLGKNKINMDCVYRIKQYFETKNDVVYF